MKVHDVMTHPPTSCSPETSLDDASRRMAESPSGVLTVLGEGSRVVGILTDRDMALAISAIDGNPKHAPVADAMTRDVYTCSPDEKVSVALERMADAKVRRLPVVAANGALVGTLSIDDVILWGVNNDGVKPKELLRALRAICSAHEPLLQTESLDVL